MPPRGPLTTTRLPFDIRNVVHYVRPLPGLSDTEDKRIVTVSQIAKLIYHSVQYPTIPVKQTHGRISYNVADVAFSADVRNTVAVICSTFVDVGIKIASAVPVKIGKLKPTKAQLRVPLKALSNSITNLNVSSMYNTLNFAAFVMLTSSR